MMLIDWMQAKGLTDEQVARLLTAAGRPTSRSTVTRWRLGERTPRPPFMRALVDLTQGRVKANDLLATEDRVT